jgi:hypothetical protein
MYRCADEVVVCQIAGVIAMMRCRTRNVTPAGVPAVPSEVKLGPCGTRNILLLHADAQTSGGLFVAGELPGAPVIGELVPRRDSVPVIRQAGPLVGFGQRGVNDVPAAIKCHAHEGAEHPNRILGLTSYRAARSRT